MVCHYRGACQHLIIILLNVHLHLSGPGRITQPYCWAVFDNCRLLSDTTGHNLEMVFEKWRVSLLIGCNKNSVEGDVFSFSPEVYSTH